MKFRMRLAAVFASVIAAVSGGIVVAPSAHAGVTCVASIDSPDAPAGRGYVDAAFSTKCDGGRAFVEAVGVIQRSSNGTWVPVQSFVYTYGNPQDSSGWRTNTWVGTHARGYCVFGPQTYRLKVTGRASLNGSSNWVWLRAPNGSLEYISPSVRYSC